jgi:hypothetical protein
MEYGDGKMRLESSEERKEKWQSSCECSWESEWQANPALANLEYCKHLEEVHEQHSWGGEWRHWTPFSRSYEDEEGFVHVRKERTKVVD